MAKFLRRLSKAVNNASNEKVNCQIAVSISQLSLEVTQLREEYVVSILFARGPQKDETNGYTLNMIDSKQQVGINESFARISSFYKQENKEPTAVEKFQDKWCEFKLQIKHRDAHGNFVSKVVASSELNMAPFVHEQNKEVHVTLNKSGKDTPFKNIVIKAQFTILAGKDLQQRQNMRGDGSVVLDRGAFQVVADNQDHEDSDSDCDCTQNYKCPLTLQMQKLSKREIVFQGQVKMLDIDIKEADALKWKKHEELKLVQEQLAQADAELHQQVTFLEELRKAHRDELYDEQKKKNAEEAAKQGENAKQDDREIQVRDMEDENIFW